jgi:recombination protein RecA
LYGVAGGGKTSLAMYLIAQIQKQGGKALFVDAEMCFSNEYAEQLGVDTKELVLSQPNNGDEALEIVDEMVRSSAVDIIVIDSVASLVPKAELEGDIGKDSIALQARLLSKACRILTGSISKTKTIVIFINQLRDQVGIFWGNKSITPGGKALKFYSSIRLEVKNVKKLKDSKDEVYGNVMEVSVTKNKVGMPWRKCQLNLIYGEGIDTVADLFNVAEERKIITKSGNTYSFGDIVLKVGKDHSIKFLKENQEILEKIEAAISS